MKKTLLSSLIITGLLAGCGGGGGTGNPGNTSGTNTPAAVPVAYLYGLGPPFLPDPNTSSGEYLYAFGPTGLYLATLSASGTITITENTAIQPLGSNLLGVAWIDPTGTYMYVSNFDGISNSDSLSQYLINADGSVTPGSNPTIQLSSGGIGGNGGNILYPGFYDTADGILMIGYGHSFATFEYNALNGSLKTLSLDVGDLFDGVLVGY